MKCITMSTAVLLSCSWNASSTEKNHLIATGLAEAGMNVSVLNLCHEDKDYDQFIKTYGDDINYEFDPGVCGSLNKGRFKITKLVNNMRIATHHFRQLMKTLRRLNPDVVILSRGSLEMDICAVILCKIFGIPLVGSIMEYAPAFPTYGHPLSRMEWTLVSKAPKAYILISDYLMKEVGKIKPSFYLPAILDCKSDKTLQQKALPNDTTTHYPHSSKDIPLLLYTSSYAYQDLLSFVFESLALVKSPFHFKITGKYPEDTLSSLFDKAKSLGIENKITFTGYLSEAELFALQLHSKALLIPLTDEVRHQARFPQKILQYMMMGKPVISSSIGEIKKNFHDGITMIIDETNSIPGYASRISFALDDPQAAILIGERGKEFVKNTFDYIKWGQKLKQFLEDV